MKKYQRLILTITWLPLLFALCWAGDYKLEDQEKIHEMLDLPAAKTAKGVKIDNIFGSITVIGYSGSQVEMSAVKTIKADSDSSLEDARADVNLDIRHDGGYLNIIVDGPFRNEKGNVNWNRDFGYIVKYDFEVKVPHNTSIDLHTVNDGTIYVEEIDGDFNVKNVNGKITLDGMAGSGRAHTVNGPVHVVFKRNPAGECSFKTINGKVECLFPTEPSNDFVVKTFNGEIYSDFSTESFSLPAGQAKKNGAKYIYKSNRFQGVRTGSGGPKITMDTLNGNIVIGAAR